MSVVNISSKMVLIASTFHIKCKLDCSLYHWNSNAPTDVLPGVRVGRANTTAHTMAAATIIRMINVTPKMHTHLLLQPQHESEDHTK